MTIEKNGPVQSIVNTIIGETDSSGNKIRNVLAKNNEFAIYEIEHRDPNNKLRVLIDGYTNQSEEAIQNRFNKVKQKYIEAKGLLSKASNYETMKHRVAHTLSSCLSSDEIDGNKEFDSLIAQINREHGVMVKNRVLYLTPCLFAVVLFFIITLWFAASINSSREWHICWQVFTSLLAASLGGGLSMLVTAKNLNFEEFTAEKHYLVLGLERWILACMAGAIAFVLIKSKVVLPEIENFDHWKMMAILILSGFSESFIPGVLGKLKKPET